jgi:autotransporter passenger strand-loop-strand repeat protein
MSIVYDTVASSYDTFNVSTPLSAWYTAIDAGGQQDVYGGGYAYEAYVSGTEYVGSGGSDQFSQVYSGGVEYVDGDGAPRMTQSFTRAALKKSIREALPPQHTSMARDIPMWAASIRRPISTAAEPNMSTATPTLAP